MTARVSSKGQVSIPGNVRRRPRLTQGSVLRFVAAADGVRLVPAAGDVRRLQGWLARPELPVSIDDMNSAIAARRAQLGRA